MASAIKQADSSNPHQATPICSITVDTQLNRPVGYCRYRQSELVHARWAMLGVAGVLGQEILRPDVFWYEAGLPQNLPGPFQNINMGGLLAWEFLLMHWVEVRRWQDYKNFGSVNEVRHWRWAASSSSSRVQGNCKQGSCNGRGQKTLRSLRGVDWVMMGAAEMAITA